jgi:hypothetical protein
MRKCRQQLITERSRNDCMHDAILQIQANGAISYSPGRIKIVDLDALKAMSCECYDTLLEQASRHQQGMRPISIAEC